MRGEREAGGSLFKLVNGSLARQLSKRSGLAASWAGIHRDHSLLALQVTFLGETLLMLHSVLKSELCPFECYRFFYQRKP